MPTPDSIISIIGQGVVGLTCATVLSEAGHRVEIVAPPEMPLPISRLAGGMLAPFCEGESAPEIVVQQGAGSIKWWEAHVDDVRRDGTLVIAPPRDQSELLRFSNQTRGHQWVTPVTLEPDLGNRFAKGLFFSDEAHLDPRKALSQLVSRLRRVGTEFRSSPSSAFVVDARGFAATETLPGLRGVRGEMLLVKNPDISITRPVRLLHPRFPCYIVPREGNQFMIGATMIETAFNGRPTAQSVMELLSAAVTVHPSFGNAEILEFGAGVRPAFKDNIPRWLAHNGRLHINGMYRHGFLMAPHCAEALAYSLRKI